MRLEQVLPLNSKRLLPVCTGGQRPAPPEDCGAPDRQQRRSVRAKILLEFRIERDITPVFEDQIELNLLSPGPGHVVDVERAAIGRYLLRVGPMKVLKVADGRCAQRVAAGPPIFRRWRPPISFPRVPGRGYRSCNRSGPLAARWCCQSPVDRVRCPGRCRRALESTRGTCDWRSKSRVAGGRPVRQPGRPRGKTLLPRRRITPFPEEPLGKGGGFKPP